MGGIINRFESSNRMYGVGYFGEGEYKARDENGNMEESYRKWFCMLQRCYCTDYEGHGVYGKVKVDDRWHNYQVFAKWFHENKVSDDVKYDLDKDIFGGTLYSPETCILIPREINRKICRNKKKKSFDLPVGVEVSRSTRELSYVCHARINGKQITKYGFKTPEEAFLWYKEQKENYIKRLAEEYKSVITPRAYEALLAYEVKPFPYEEAS